MAGVSVRRIETTAFGLALLVAGIHLAVAVAGLLEYQTSGQLPDIRTPVFLLVSLAIIAASIAVVLGRLRRDLAYSLGAVLMAGHLVAYLDWHILHIFEGFVDLGELGHGHAHGTIDRDLAAAMADIWGDPVNALDHAASVSVVISTLQHAIAAPVEFVAKTAELILLGLLLLLRWAYSADQSTVNWELREQDLTAGVIAGVIGLGIWMALLWFGGVLVGAGADPLFVDLLEVAAFGLLLGWIGWFFIGRPIVTHATPGTAPSLLQSIPGLDRDARLQRVGFAGVYLVAFLALTAGMAGVVPTDDGHHHSHDDDPGLDRLVETLEGQGVDIDGDRLMVHYSEFHGGDALLLYHNITQQSDRSSVEADIEVITDAYVDAVSAGEFDDIVVILAEAQTPDGDQVVWWEVDQTWVDEYLDGSLTRDELLEEIFSTYELR